MPRGRPRDIVFGSSREQSQLPSLVPPKWQARFAEMEARVLRAEAELREIREQAQQQAPVGDVPLAVMPAMIPQVVEDHREPLYE